MRCRGQEHSHQACSSERCSSGQAAGYGCNQAGSRASPSCAAATELSSRKHPAQALPACRQHLGCRQAEQVGPRRAAGAAAAATACLPPGQAGCCSYPHPQPPQVARPCSCLAGRILPQQLLSLLLQFQQLQRQQGGRRGQPRGLQARSFTFPQRQPPQSRQPPQGQPRPALRPQGRQGQEVRWV